MPTETFGTPPSVAHLQQIGADGGGPEGFGRH